MLTDIKEIKKQNSSPIKIVIKQYLNGKNLDKKKKLLKVKATTGQEDEEDTPNEDDSSNEDEERQLKINNDKKKKKKKQSIDFEEDKETKYDRKESLNSSDIRTSSSL
jgi:hypothetical protein